MATKGRFLPLVLAGLLVVAQHAALWHGTWHAFHYSASAQGPDSSGTGAPKNGGKESRLCVFHTALGQVLAGAHGHAVCVSAPDGSAERVSQAPLWRATASFLSFSSRGPPALL